MLVSGALVLAGAVVVGSAVPSPANWFASEDDKVVDVEVSTGVHWTPLGGLFGVVPGQGSWSMDQPSFTVADSHWLNVRAWFANRLSFTSDSLPVRIVLEDASTGATLHQLRDSTGSGGLLGSDKDVRVIFREVPPGAYTIRASIMQGETAIASSSRPLTIVPGGSS